VEQKQKETRSNKDNVVELSLLNSSFSGVLYVKESAREVSLLSTNNISPLTTIYGIYQGSITSQAALGGISTLRDAASHAEAGNIVRWMGPIRWAGRLF
jgi:dihydroorotate dehydrogenase